MSSEWTPPEWIASEWQQLLDLNRELLGFEGTDEAAASAFSDRFHQISKAIGQAISERGVAQTKALTETLVVLAEATEILGDEAYANKIRANAIVILDAVKGCLRADEDKPSIDAPLEPVQVKGGPRDGLNGFGINATGAQAVLVIKPGDVSLVQLGEQSEIPDVVEEIRSWLDAYDEGNIPLTPFVTPRTMA